MEREDFMEPCEVSLLLADHESHHSLLHVGAGGSLEHDVAEQKSVKTIKVWMVRLMTYWGHGPPGSLKQHCLDLLANPGRICFVRVLFCLTGEPLSVTVGAVAGAGAVAPAAGGMVAIGSGTGLKACAK